MSAAAVAPTWWQRRRDAWLAKRLPSSREITFNQRRIFIVPSKTALALFATITVLLLLAINFQNALVYAVSFWLVALVVINILYTWRNLAGLTLRAVGIEPCFAGENAVVEWELVCPADQQRLAIVLTWPEQDSAQVNVLANHTQRIKLTHATTQRGWFYPPRLHITTRYPTGLVVAWSYFQADMRGLVYPAPAENPTTAAGHRATTTVGGAEVPNGSSEFGGIRAYREGDSPKHVHWKKYAQTGKLYTRAFVDYASHEQWLDWDALTMPGVEVRLAHLCSRVLALHAEQSTFGLRLPGVVIAPSKGKAHKQQCLRALALFGVDDAG